MSKRKRQSGLFDYSDHQERVGQKRSALTELNRRIDWERFRPRLEELAPVRTSEKGGRPAYDRILMFKILVLQELHNLSDAETEFQIEDRTSFRLFLNLNLQDSVPDQNTIWTFRQQLVAENAFRELFEDVLDRLYQAGLKASPGTIVDATIVEVPVQRNRRDENQQIKEDRTPEDWSMKKRSHKDVDAGWTAKHGRQYFGYKQHTKIDASTKIIESLAVTTASVHDIKMLDDLLDASDEGRTLYADAAYNSADVAEALDDEGITNRIHHRATSTKQLTSKQNKQNASRTKKRSRVEHVFAQLKRGCMKFHARCIGISRVESKQFLRSLLYNLQRFIYLTKHHGRPVPI